MLALYFMGNPEPAYVLGQTYDDFIRNPDFKGPWGVSVARNLTPDEGGQKNWSDAEIARAIREGVSRDGSKLKPPMAYSWYRNINDGDIKAITAYLRSLKPVPTGGAAK